MVGVMLHFPHRWKEQKERREDGKMRARGRITGREIEIEKERTIFLNVFFFLVGRGVRWKTPAHRQ